MLKPDPVDPIVVTGMGAISPVGVGVDALWSGLINGRSGIVRNDRFDTADFVSHIAGLVPRKPADPNGFDPADFIDAKEIKKMDLFIQYAIGAASEALDQAAWHPATGRSLPHLGSGITSFQIGSRRGLAEDLEWLW